MQFLLGSPNRWKGRRVCVVIFPKVLKSSLIFVVPVIMFLAFGFLHASLRGKPSSWSLFKFHFCHISVNTSISLDHPQCILFWWLIFHIISKQKDNTDKSSTKTCHGIRYWKKKKKRGIETDPNRNTMVLLYEPSAVKKKEKKARLAKEGRQQNE